MVVRQPAGWGAASNDPIDEYLDFRRELRQALRQLSPVALRGVVRRWAGPREVQLHQLIAQPDAMLEPIIRKMILEEPQLADMHDQARLWLVAHEPAPIRPRVIAPTDHRRTTTRRKDGDE
jgi:hypothetical protein